MPRRYLIVFDDVWTVTVWDKILDSLKVTSNNNRSADKNNDNQGSDVNDDNNHGSRIIITTRMVDVAEHVGGLYHLPLLSGNDSKMLFYRRTYFCSEDNCPSQFKELSKRMLSKCGQLPLAIIVITKLLPESMVLEEWQNSCGSIEMGNGMENIITVLKYSYDHLPEFVKPCLLYLSIFPEGCEIRRDGLVKRWIAEHLIPGDDGQNLQQLGESYFSELVNSSMIQQIESDSFLKDLVYSIHVTTLDLIVSLSIDEDFVTIVAGMQRSHLQQKIERLSLQVSNEQYDVLKATKTVGGVSSLSVFCGTDLIQPVSKFQGLHVLDLEKCDSLEDVHLNGLRKLYKLRYLALGSSHITAVPPKISKLKHLQTLGLTATNVKQLPSSIAKLTQLRRLLINRSTEVPDNIIGKLQALEELVEIDISKSPSILEGISTMAGLRVLSIGMWSWDEHSSTLLSDALCKLSTQKLKRLSISTCCLLDLKPDLQPVLEQLEELEIQDRTFNTLPILIGQLNNLVSLSIEVYTLEKDALRTLGKLPQLLFLSLLQRGPQGESWWLLVRNSVP